MEKNQILQELKQGAKSWNSWRKNHAAEDLKLDGVEFSGSNFNEYDFSKLSICNASFVNCSFKYADLISANLECSKLTNNDFSHAKLIAAKLNSCDLSGSILYNTNMLTASILNAKLENIDFTGHDISGLSLKNISLAGSNLEGQQLSRVDFSNSNLSGVNFKNADLSNSVMSGANLTNANVKNANLIGAVFKSANLCNVDLSGMNLRKADFSGANLLNCDLRETHLDKSKLSRADLTGTKLWKVTTEGWVISSCLCKYAYWDKEGKEKTIYRTHEFERVFAESITIELRYPYRLADHELATLPIFIEHLAAVHWGIILRLKSITDVSGGALVLLVVVEIGGHNPTQLKAQLQAEADRIQMAQLTVRSNNLLHIQLKEKIASIREEFWPRLLELAADHEKDQMRTLTILFMDLKGFSKWADDELSEKLSLFRGLTKPILNKWAANHPNMEGDSLRVTFKNAAAGLSCACMMRNVLTAAGFELRIGVELGEVVVVHNEITDNLDLQGMAVSMAARLEAAAEPGEVLVTHRIRHYAERSDLFNFTPRRVQLKKGIGAFEQGEHIECFAVVANKNLHDTLT
jgi:uncharacterized protein YjbI with pentapeptide repeats/class 3 adenylate cyclase